MSDSAAIDTSADKGIEAPDVVDKYKASAEIANGALDVVRRFAYAGMSVVKLCALGDAKVEKDSAAVYNKARSANGEKLDKGVAFPTCISRNNCAAHYSPLSEDDSAVLAGGDIITIQIGAHIDGYAAMAATTEVVRAMKEDEPAIVSASPKADAMVAAYTASQAVLRVMRPGRTNDQVTDVICAVAKDFGVQPLEGVLSHQVKRYVVDGSKVLLNRKDVDSGTRVDAWEFEENEVYAIDIVMSTGAGKAKEIDSKPTVFKRQVDVDYKLKMKASRAVFSEVNKRFPTMPFTLRALEDAKRARLGMTELVSHGLVLPYPVLYEREGQTIARVCMTVLILPSQTMPITACPAPPASSDKTVTDPNVVELLATSIEKKKKAKRDPKPAPMES
jgi:curved DNA binding protein